MASEEERKREKVKENEEGDEFISLRRRDVCTERLQRAFKLVGKYWTSSSSTGSTGGSVWTRSTVYLSMAEYLCIKMEKASKDRRDTQHQTIKLRQTGKRTESSSFISDARRRINRQLSGRRLQTWKEGLLFSLSVAFPNPNSLEKSLSPPPIDVYLSVRVANHSRNSFCSTSFKLVFLKYWNLTGGIEIGSV